MPQPSGAVKESTHAEASRFQSICRLIGTYSRCELSKGAYAAVHFSDKPTFRPSENFPTRNWSTLGRYGDLSLGLPGGRSYLEKTKCRKRCAARCGLLYGLADQPSLRMATILVRRTQGSSWRRRHCGQLPGGVGPKVEFFRLLPAGLLALKL